MNSALPDVLRELARPVEPPAPPDKLPTSEEQLQALRLYASGRERLLRGDATGALANLRQAAALDPISGEVWLALGDAQGATGARAESLASIDRAARLGAGGARPWELLGRAALSTGNNEQAAGFLARAVLQAAGQDSDPALQSLIGIELGQALDGLGYARAAVDSLAASLQLLDSVQGTQRYRAEIAAIARRRGDLWVRVGDLACRAGDYSHAVGAYRIASDLSAFGSGRDGLSERIVFASLRAGRPAAAAAAILDSIAAQDGWVSGADMDLCDYLRDKGGAETARLLAAALDEFANTRQPPPTPALKSRLALARASLESPRQRTATLESTLKQRPSDDAAAIALLTDAEAVSIGDAARVSVRLTSSAPLRSETYARALLATEPLSGMIAALDASNDRPAADLLAGRLLGAADRPDEALSRLDRAAARSKPDSLLRLGAELAIAEVAAGAGRWQELDLATSTLNKPWPGLDEGSVLWARAGALAAAQRFDGAIDALRRLADAPSEGSAPEARMEYLLAAGELASRLTLAEDAERWIRSAAELDAFDERVYVRQFGLYGAGGPTADQAKSADVLRRLRQNCPDGRLLRTLRAQDTLRRGSPDDALRQALALAREDVTDESALELLADTCERWSARKDGAGVPAEAEAYLRARLDKAPDDPGAVVALSRILAAGGSTDEAETLLRARVSTSPQRDVSRALERLLRKTPSGAEEADRLALQRLGAAGGSAPRPRSITESIELAELLQHLGRTSEAVDALRIGIPEGASLTANQAQVVIDIANRATATGGNAPDETALALLDLAVARGVKLPRELQGRRIVLLISDPKTPPDILLSAANRLATDYPDLGSLPYVFVLRNLSAAESTDTSESLPRRAMAFAQLAVGVHPDADLLADWLRLIATFGDATNAKRMIDAALAAKLEAEVIRKLESSADQSAAPTPPAPTGSAGGAELAQITGDLASALGRGDESARMYRLSLDYDPSHAWAANNLGYHLAETARRPDGTIDTAALEESERLLAIAAAALPDDGSVLDSLGWVRYRRGILRDQKDAEGKVVLEGAVTLLARAARTSKGEDNATILDHLGDALWLAGDHDTAAGAWGLSEQAARQRLDRLRGANVPRRALEEVSELLGQVSAKLAAVRAGMAPQVGWTMPGT